MTSHIRTAKARQRGSIWGLLLLLVAYFLSLCVLSPQAHAALILQAVQNQQNTTGHCTGPAIAGDATDSPSPGQQGTRLPVCCGVVSLHKATKATSFHLDFFPAVVVTCLPFKTLCIAWDVSSHYPAQADYSPHSPALYLFQAILLI